MLVNAALNPCEAGRPCGAEVPPGIAARSSAASARMLSGHGSAKAPASIEEGVSVSDQWFALSSEALLGQPNLKIALTARPA